MGFYDVPYEKASVILGVQWGGGSKVTKAYLSEMFQNSHNFWGAEGESKVTKAYLSEMFRNSIILKGSERLFHVGWGFMMFDI